MGKEGRGCWTTAAFLLTIYPRRGDKMTTHSGELLMMTPIRISEAPLLSA